MKRSFLSLLSAAILIAVPGISRAQTTKPTEAQAQAALSDPQMRARILEQVKSSGKSDDEIRTQLKALGYSDVVINQVVGGAGSDTTAMTDDVFSAIRALGLMDSTALDSLRKPFVARKKAQSKADEALLDSLGLIVKDDKMRAAIRNLMASTTRRQEMADSGFELFGRTVFETGTTRFDPAVNGPLPPTYRIGFGDQFTLVLTGELEKTSDLVVMRDGSIFVRDVGQIPASNLTFEQLRNTLEERLGRVYSGIRTGATKFSILPTKVGTNQVFVLGDVKAPNSYQVSRLATVLTALYAAGGPVESGNSRTIDVKRNGQVIATVDLYDYLMSGSSASDVRLENGDVVFVRPSGGRVRVAGAVVRPATYELKAGETLTDVIRMSGGFRPEADRRRVQIERIIPAERRATAGSDKEIIDVPLAAAATGTSNQKIEAGDVVRVFTVDSRLANRIEVEGNVWAPSLVAYTPGMRLSDAIARAGGLKADTYLGAVQISRLAADSSRTMLRVALGADGKPANDIAIAPLDVIHAFSLTEYRPQRYVTVGGAVKTHDVAVPFQEGMTMRDALMLVGGLKESALLTEAEISHLPENRANGVTAVIERVPLDSSYLFERGPDGKYSGPPGVPVPPGRNPEVLLRPYDAISILEQPDFQYQRTVSVSGRVKFAGQYALKTKTERLGDLIQRAGGLSADAYPAGIVFTRSHDNVGRIGIDLPAVLKNASSIDNILLVDGDDIFIPPFNAIVLVRGAVNSPAAAVPYVKGKNLDYYLDAAGRGTSVADESRAYVLQPSGKVESRRRSLVFFESVPRPEPGSVVNVPLRNPNEKSTDWAQITSTTVSVLASLATVALLAVQIKKQ